MKRKTKFLLVALMLIGCLSLVLVGCVDDKPGPQPEPPTTQEIIDEAIGKITDSFAVNGGDMIGIDVKAAVDYKKKAADGSISAKGTYRGSDLGLEIVAKANANIYEGSSDADNYYLLEFNLYNESNPEGYAVLRLYMENLTDPDDAKISENVMFIQILGSELYKVNAFSVMHLFNQTLGTSETADINIGEMLPTIIAAMFSDAKVENNVYTLTFNFAGVWELLSGVLSGGLDSILGSNPIIGDMTIDGLLNAGAKELGSALNIMYDTGEKNPDGTPKMELVKDVKTLMQYCNENLPAVNCDVVISFDTDDYLTGIAANVNVDPKGDDKGFVIDANVSPITVNSDTMLSKDDVLKDSFVLAKKDAAGQPVYATEALRFAAEKINILNIQTYGSVDILNSEDGVVRAMDFNLNANIDPFALIYGHSQKDFMKMGYFTLDVALSAGNDPTDDATFNPASTPIMQIYFNPEKTGDDSIYIYLALVTDNANPFANPDNHLVLATSISLSGLISTITGEEGLVNNGVVQTAETDILDTIKQLLAAVKDAVAIDKTAGPLQGSVTLDMLDLSASLKDIIGIDLSAPILGNFTILGLLVGNNGAKIRIDVDNFLYGYAEAIDFDLERLIKHVASGKINHGDGLVNAATAEAAVKEYTTEYGTEIEDIIGGNIGVNYKDAVATLHENVSLTINKVVGYDPTVVGPQKVTVMVSAQSEFGDLLSLVMLMLAPDVNIYDYISVIPVEITINVREPEAAASIRANGIQTLLVGENIFDVVQPVMVFGNRVIEMHPYNFAGNMNIDADGNVLAAGNYILSFESSGQTATIEIAAAEIITPNTTMKFGDSIVEKSTLSARYANNNGMLIKGDVDNYTITDIRVLGSGGNNITSKMVGDDNTLITQDAALGAGVSASDIAGSTIEVSSTFSILGNKYSRTVSYQLLPDAQSLLINDINGRVIDGARANVIMPTGGLINGGIYYVDENNEAQAYIIQVKETFSGSGADAKLVSRKYVLAKSGNMEQVADSEVKFYSHTDKGDADMITDKGLIKTDFVGKETSLKIAISAFGVTSSRVFPYAVDEFGYSIVKVKAPYEYNANNGINLVRGKKFEQAYGGLLQYFTYYTSEGKEAYADTSNASKIVMDDENVTVVVETKFFAAAKVEAEGVALVDQNDIVTAVGVGTLKATIKVSEGGTLKETIENVELGKVSIEAGELSGVESIYYKGLTTLALKMTTYTSGTAGTPADLATSDLTLKDAAGAVVENAFIENKIADSVAAGVYTLSATKNDVTATAQITVSEYGVLPDTAKWTKGVDKTYTYSSNVVELLETLGTTIGLYEMLGYSVADGTVFDTFGIALVGIDSASITKFEFKASSAELGVRDTDFMAVVDGKVGYLTGSVWTAFNGNAQIYGTLTVVINDVTLKLDLAKGLW